MKRTMFHVAVLAAILSAAAPRGTAQNVTGNVTGYDLMPNPILLLLREPAVLDDLRLTDEQRRTLRQLNDEIDDPLLALRNWPAEKANEKLSELIVQSRNRLDDILDEMQRQRLIQIMLRVRGIKLVLMTKVADRLKLSSEQRTDIEPILNETTKQLKDLQERLQDGEPREHIEKLALRVREREQFRVLDELSSEQKQLLRELLGRGFDVSRLGRVSFKAPEVVDSGGWINTAPLRRDDLRGQVIALHFWAFG